LLKDAFDATAAHRGTTEQIADIPALLTLIKNSAELMRMWDKYRKEFSCAEGITYEQVVEALVNICKELF
jgi:hypothetical protein